MSTLLDWALATTPNPPQASWPREQGDSPRTLTLTFTANVPLELQKKQQVVYCDKVTFTLDVGASGSDDAALLTSIATGIEPRADSSGAWALVQQTDPQSSQAIVLTRTFDRNGSDKKIVQQGYTFTIANIQVNSAVGTAEVTVTEHSADPVGLEAAAPAPGDYELRSTTFSVPKFPPDFGPVSFDASLQPDGKVKLTWQGDASAPGVSYEISWPGGSPLENLKPSDTQTVGPFDRDTLFTLAVTRDPGDGTKPITSQFQKMILVDTEAQLEGDRDTVRSGETVDLWWYTQNVDDCSIVDDRRTKTSLEGLQPPHPMKVATGSAIRKASFQLIGTDRFTKELYTSNLFPVTVLPMAPAAKAQLVLIQTLGNLDGRLTIRVNDGASHFQERLHDVETGWTEPGDVGIAAPGSDSTMWQIFNFCTVKPMPDLAFIEARDGTTGVKVSAIAAPGYGTDSPCAATAFASPAPTGFFEMAHWPFKLFAATLFVNALYFVQTAATASGNIEVQCARAKLEMAPPYESPYENTLGYKPTPYPLDGPKGTWLIADMDADLLPELVFVRTDRSKSRVELSYAKLSETSSSAQPDKTWVTGFPTVGAGNGSWQLADMTGDGKLDLVFVQTESTASGRVEIHWAVAARDYKHVDGGFTGFDLSLGHAGTWQVIGNDSPYRF